MTYKQLWIVFLFITVSYISLMQFDIIQRIDLLVNKWSYSISTPVTDVFWRMFTLLGETETLAVLSIIIIALLYWQKKIKEMIVYIFMISTGVLITFCLKIFIQKDRPGEVEYIDFLGFGEEMISYSFPSGHAVKSLLLFGFLIWFIRKTYQKNQYTLCLTKVLIMAIVFCGVGQIFLHEHYLSDVMGGFLIGITIHSFSLWMYYLWEERQKEYGVPFRNVQ